MHHVRLASNVTISRTKRVKRNSKKSATSCRISLYEFKKCTEEVADQPVLGDEAVFGRRNKQTGRSLTIVSREFFRQIISIAKSGLAQAPDHLPSHLGRGSDRLFVRNASSSVSWALLPVSEFATLRRTGLQAPSIPNNRPRQAIKTSRTSSTSLIPLTVCNRQPLSAKESDGRWRPSYRRASSTSSTSSNCLKSTLHSLPSTLPPPHPLQTRGIFDTFDTFDIFDIFDPTRAFLPPLHSLICLVLCPLSFVLCPLIRHSSWLQFHTSCDP